MEREAVLVGIDVGTTKVVALIGEVGRDGGVTIIGKGTVPASGLRKGVVVNIDQTVHSITAAVEKAERTSIGPSRSPGRSRSHPPARSSTSCRVAIPSMARRA